MNLRCTYCQTPFTVGRLEKLAALQRMHAENLHHYDVFCPRCRRANSVSRQRLEIFTPGWQEGLRTLEAEASKVEQQRVEPAAAPVEATSAPAPAEAARNRHTHRPAAAASAQAESAPKKPAAKKAVAKTNPSPAAKPATKKAPAKKTAAKAKPSPKAKPAAKKPAKTSAKVAKKSAKPTSSSKGKSTAKKVVKKK